MVTVKELIVILEKHSPDAEVRFSDSAPLCFIWQDGNTVFLTDEYPELI